jgi:hypothetical protein
MSGFNETKDAAFKSKTHTENNPKGIGKEKKKQWQEGEGGKICSTDRTPKSL